MKVFLTKLFRFSLVFIIPLLIFGSLYIAYDPFKVIYTYDTLVETDVDGMVTINQDYISTTTFINNSKNVDYNSFIFGNSRSIFYQISDWKKHLDEDAICYHFDASGESIWAINKKFEFIDNFGSNIDNVLLILDYSTLIEDGPKSTHLGIISPALVNNSNIIEFHKTFFFTFLNPKFLYAFLDFKISGKVKPYMKRNSLIDDRPRNYDPLTNELRFDHFEDLIKYDKYYTSERLSVFYDRDTTTQRVSPESILENQEKMLKNIHSIIEKHNAAIKIIINPLYNQIKFNENDLLFLKKLFGKENVFDFSGINEFTNDYRNYYENSHYRPHVARKIMEIVYENN